MKQVIYKGLRITFCKRFPFGAVNDIVTLDSSCWYENPTGWSKLVGFTSLGIHRNSIRIGWRPDKVKDTFKLCIYEYIKGVRIIRELGTVTAGVENHIYISKGNIVINGLKFDYAAKGCFIRTNFYGEGAKPMPHKMFIKIKKQ